MTARHLLATTLLILTHTAMADQCQYSGRQVLWGDLHIHTGFSMDAYAFGARVDPAAAYRFAKGAPRTLIDGAQHALARPLDFAAVTDHAENFGVMGLCASEQIEHEYCEAFEAVSDGRSRDGFTRFFLPALAGQVPPVCAVEGGDCRAAQLDLWSRTIEAAESANEPCEFTAFVANEWSAMPGDLHLHRNLIYASSTVPRVPVNAIDEPHAADMWRALAQRCRPENGCDVLAIAHNPNLGMGVTFGVETLDARELELRRNYERVMEIHQHKGQSECYPGAGFTDEACAFEIRLPTPLIGKGTLTPGDHARVASGYARQALSKGLLASLAGAPNPLRLGFIGSTDTHDGRPGDVEERGWRGHVGRMDTPGATRHQLAVNNPGGLAAVWVRENTREAIFAALERRETYATSGPRIQLEVFATREPGDWCASDGMPDDTVVMGGTLSRGRDAPVFYVRALKDHTPLARVDIVKLFVAGGKTQQTIRTVRTGDAGAASVCARFEDGDIAPEQPALWYARVLEQATPRWRSETGEVQESIRERAWSSPIWNSTVNGG
jgi:hypothetical protein